MSITANIAESVLKSHIARSDPDAILILLTEVIKQLDPYSLSFEATLELEKVVKDHMNKMDPLNKID